MLLPNKKYDIIYADPPWNFKSYSKKGDGRNATQHYDCMTIKDICNLPVKDISKDNAWDYVAGLTVGQDISDRPVQFHATPPQFNLGKSFDTFGPLGPYIVSTDEFKNKESLKLECWVNDEKRQDTNTNDLIFDIHYIISYISEFITHNVGDLIFTGTPAGVCATQGKFLKDGDLL